MKCGENCGEIIIYIKIIFKECKKWGEIEILLGKCYLNFRKEMGEKKGKSCIIYCRKDNKWIKFIWKLIN